MAVVTRQQARGRFNAASGKNSSVARATKAVRGRKMVAKKTVATKRQPKKLGSRSNSKQAPAGARSRSAAKQRLKDKLKRQQLKEKQRREKMRLKLQKQRETEAAQKRGRKDRERARAQARAAAERERARKQREKERAKRKAAKEKERERERQQKAQLKQKALRLKEREKLRAAAKVAHQAAVAERKAARQAEAEARREAAAQAALAARVFCAGCAGMIAKDMHTAAGRIQRCTFCGTVFHTRCLLPDVFVGDSVPKALTSASCCVRCCCGRVGGAPATYSATKAYLRDGFAVCDVGGGQETKDLLEATGRQINDLFKRLMQAYEIKLNSGENVPTLQTGYTNFRMRGAGRYEIIAPEITTAVLMRLVRPGSEVRKVVDELLPVVSHLKDPHRRRAVPKGMAALTDDIVVHASGCIFATPGAEGQNWHTDGPLQGLAEGHDDGLPYAVNVFLPLVDVGSHNGTHFAPGTHRPSTLKPQDGDGAIDVAAEADELARAVPRVIPSANVGQALLFDYRVVHKGGPNKGTVNRPLLYITFTRRWYKGDVNFSGSRYKGALVPTAPRSRGGDAS